MVAVQLLSLLYCCLFARLEAILMNTTRCLVHERLLSGVITKDFGKFVSLAGIQKVESLIVGMISVLLTW